MKKRKELYLIVFILLSMVLGSHGVLAQGPQPPFPYPDPRSQGSGHVISDDPIAGKPFSLHPFSHTQSTTSLEGVTLGEPGLTFRYVDTYGITEEAYPVSTAYLHRPNGLYIDGSDNVYVTEEHGCRVLKYNASGTHLLSIGTAGLCWTSDDIFSGPQDVALDGSGNIWVADQWHRMVQYNASGNFQQTLPENNSWENGSDNTHFNFVNGVAFDSSGRMFVADRWNHRVQIYTFSGGDPVYQSTIGETGVSGSDDSHFNNPSRLALDSSDRLYVVDTMNGRVQRCTENGSWSCATFESGLGWPEGIDVDNSDQVYIADDGAGKVRKCTSGGTCSDFVTGLSGELSDVAVASSGDVYLSDRTHHVVRKYDSSGTYQGVFLGTEDVPYQVDTTRINTPYGVVVADDGSIYVTEDRGYRLLKLDAAGSQIWSVGEAGVFGDDNDHFGNFWGGPQGGLAVDSSDRVYVPDTSNHRIQIFNANGTYSSSFGSYGTGNDQFDGPSGVAIHPTNGDLYVVDRWNHRVQVYDSSWTYKATIGTTGVSGDDGTHFDSPMGVAVDASGNVYVADTNNHRVQVCTHSGGSGTCTTFVGQTGSPGYDFDHLNNPTSLAVDSDGRVYVTDVWNNRVQVFNSSGAYLTTIGGSWGAGTGGFRSPSDVAVDSEGNVYVTDWSNHRVQKFAPGYPGWAQVNINGFGDPNQGISALADFGGYLYAGTWRFDDTAAQVWRTDNSSEWTEVTPAWGLGNHVVFDIEVFDGYLYVGTSNENGGEVWRTGGTSWEQVASGGFDDTHNSIYALKVFSNAIYAATSNLNTGIEIWRSTSGDLGAWTQVNSDGFGSGGTGQDITMEVFDNYLYVGLGRGDPLVAELWRSSDGTAWSSVFTGGLGNVENTHISSMEVFDGQLYLGLRNATTGGEVWRSSNGTDFSQVFENGLGDPNNLRPYGLIQYAGDLYLVFVNLIDGDEIWTSVDGTSWQQIVSGGWGDSGNRYGDYFDKVAAIYDQHLYIGWLLGSNGGKIWMMQVPEMDILGNGLPIPDGDDTPSTADGTDFGSLTLTGSPINHTFTIENNGDGDLELSGVLKVEITGTHAGDFSVTSQPSSPVPPEDSTTFTVTFDPSAVGLRTASVSIANNDGDENPYTFDIQGTGLTFADVPLDYWAFDYIEALYQSGITGGCSVDPPLYCPSDTVTRDQMAVFLERGIHGSSYAPPAPTGLFDDVPVDYWAAKFIEALYNDGITGGCGGGNYCPGDPVTRAQMAVFLLRSKHGSSYTPPAATGQFNDVPLDHWAADWIEQLAAEGITSGCGGGNYCPEDSVTRDQMAVFLVRTFNLPIP